MQGRDDSGKFKKGEYRGGPGRPKKSKEERYYDILISTVSLNDWRDIVKRAVGDAKRGDASARTWLSNYIIGQPKQTIELGNKDGLTLIIRGPGAEDI